MTGKKLSSNETRQGREFLFVRSPEGAGCRGNSGFGIFRKGEHMPKCQAGPDRRPENALNGRGWHRCFDRRRAFESFHSLTPSQLGPRVRYVGGPSNSSPNHGQARFPFRSQTCTTPVITCFQRREIVAPRLELINTRHVFRLSCRVALCSHPLRRRREFKQLREIREWKEKNIS